MNAPRLMKGVLGLVVVAALFMIVVNWVGDYRATSGTASQDDPGDHGDVYDHRQEPRRRRPLPAKPTAAEKVLIVQVQGLNFRQKPSGTARAFRGLAQNERVVLVSQEGAWYKVRDSSGTVGYITSNPAYTKPAQ